MSELVKVVKVNSIGSIGCWSNFEGVWEVSTSVGAVIRKQVSWSGIQACTWYQYWWQGPYQNLYDLRQYQPCTSFIWVSISGIYLPHSYQPKISLGSNIKTRLVWKAPKSTKYRGPDWYEKASKSTKYRGPDWYENFKTYPMPGQAGSVFKSHMPYQHWNRLWRLSQQLLGLITMVLKNWRTSSDIYNYGSQKSQKYQITMFITVKSLLVLSLKPFEAY
jgi:hypothetical protein